MNTFSGSSPRPALKRTLARFAGVVALALILAATPFTSGFAQSTPPPENDGQGALTPEQTEEVLRLFRKYMSDHPEDIVSALNSFAKQEETARNDVVLRTLAEGRSEIENDEGSFFGGNPDGDVSLVEFFDYRCSYCKKVHDTVRTLVEQDGNVRLVYKEFPILGPDSVVASRAALASRRQGKYLRYHDALMSARGSLNRKRILEIAGDVGLDTDRLELDMKDPEIEKIIGRNHALAQRLNIGGTPAFVIGDELIAGAAELVRLKRMVSRARTNCTTC